MDFNALLAQFWQLQVPVTLVPDPNGGVLAFAPYGERIHFRTQDEVSFFLLGYRLGTAKQEEATVPPWMAPSAPDEQQ